MKVKRNKKYKGLIDKKLLRNYIFIDCDFSECMFVECTIKECFFIDCKIMTEDYGYIFYNCSFESSVVDMTFTKEEK